MTKKDYIKLADALSGAFPVSENVTPIMAWRNACQAVIDTLKRDNPRFDEHRFVAKVTDNIN